jgi:ferric iron reductase protein FhuF
VLAALGVARLVDLSPDGRVRRRTCCLAFALPEPKVCDGCCIS